MGQLTIGHVVNLASNDVHRFDNVSFTQQCMHYSIYIN